MGQQKNKGKKGGPKIRPSRSLEPLKQNPNYLNELAMTRGRKPGTTELDAQVPRIVKDLCDPMVDTDMAFYGKFLIQEPVYTRLYQMLNYLYMIHHQQNIALTNYLSSISTPVQMYSDNSQYYQQQPAQYYPNQQYYVNYDNPQPQQQYYGYGVDPGWNDVYIHVEPTNYQQVPQQQMPIMDPYTNIDMMKGMLNLARANEEVYGGILTALATCHDTYMMYGLYNTSPFDIYINQNSKNARFVSAPDATGAEYYDKQKAIERRSNNRNNNRRNNNDRNSNKSYNGSPH